MKKILLTLLFLITGSALLLAQDTEEYDTPPKLLTDINLVVTPENGIRPANETELDLSEPMIRLEPIQNPPFGSLRFMPEDGFAEGYMNLRAILAQAYELPGYRIIGQEQVLREIYDFAYVHDHSADFFESCRSQILKVLPYQVTYKKKEVTMYELKETGDRLSLEESLPEKTTRFTASENTFSGTAVKTGHIAGWISRANKVDVLHSMETEKKFNIHFQTSSVKDLENLDKDLRSQLGLMLVPVEKKARVIVVE